MNITKITNGFIKDERDYFFQDFINDEEQLAPFQILSDSQVHVGTNDGIMFLDLSVSINNTLFNDINEFVNFLYS